MNATLEEPRVPNPEQLTDSAMDEAFLALMCSDEELLRAEFNAIVAARPFDPQRTRSGYRTSRPTSGRNHPPT